MSDFIAEVFFKTARSGGSGGQNVNKVETMAEALWLVAESRFFTDEEKATIQDKLQNKINKEGYLAVKSQESRSQLENKAIALQKMQDMVAKSLTKPKKRKPTRIPKAVKEKRLAGTKKDSLKKELRRPPTSDQ